MKTLPEFRSIATDLHRGHKYGKYQYSYHLAMVEMVARQYSYQLPERFPVEVMYIACWFHDVREDCLEIDHPQKLHDLGLPIVSVDLVEAVTDGTGATRSEKKQAMLAKCKGNLLRTFLKLCDRIANVRASICAQDFNITEEPVGKRRIDMYREEHDEFKRELYDGTLVAMWYELDVLLNQWEG
jgi:hypothetical protein